MAKILKRNILLSTYNLQVKLFKHDVATSDSADTYCIGTGLPGILAGSYRLAGCPS